MTGILTINLTMTLSMIHDYETVSVALQREGEFIHGQGLDVYGFYSRRDVERLVFLAYPNTQQR